MRRYRAAGAAIQIARSLPEARFSGTPGRLSMQGFFYLVVLTALLPQK
jgi:hypothetical protein